MNGLKLLPVIISFLLLAAHFYRSGQVILAALSLAVLLLLFLRERWMVRVFQFALVAAAAEWLITLYNIAQVRIDSGQPWSRMALILGAVALLTLFSALVFRASSLRRFYRFEDQS